MIERDNLKYQLDLVFQRADNVRIVYELKYSHAPVGVEVIKTFARAIEIYKAHNQVSLHRLITSASGIEDALRDKEFFDDVIDLNRLLEDELTS